MSLSSEDVEIIELSTGNSVTAVLHIGMEELEIIDAEADWAQPRILALREIRKAGKKAPEHVHWNWALKAVTNAHLLAVRYFGIEADSKMQGLMVVRLAGKNARLDPDKGKPLVYVDIVETAPWNAREFTTTPLYKGIGIRLIQAAAKLSIDEGFAGRVGLHSLQQSLPFYINACEMTALGRDANNNLEYFELTAKKAAELLKK